MDRNWIIFTHYGFIKNLWQIHPRDSHVKFTEKNKVTNTTWAKLCGLIGQKWQKVFSKHTCKIYLSVSGKQTSRQASGWPAVFFSELLILSSLLDHYFSEISCNYRFRQMFNGFWTSNFDFYWSLALQFSCIMVRLSEGRFLFAVASD